MYGLETEEGKLCFFINLHNFLILYALCQDARGRLPKTELSWLSYKSETAIKVGPYVFTALEIEHALLRAAMPAPQMPLPYFDDHQYFAKLSAGDPRAKLIYPKKEPLLNFPLYIPTKYRNSHEYRQVLPAAEDLHS